MTSSRSRRSGPLVLALILFGAFLSILGAGCNSDDIVSVRIGSIEVRTQTTGTTLDPDGYQVRATGGGFDLTDSIGVSGVRLFSVVAERTYTVTLSDIANNCVADLNPQFATVPTNAVAALVFNVTCT